MTILFSIKVFCEILLKAYYVYIYVCVIVILRTEELSAKAFVFSYFGFIAFIATTKAYFFLLWPSGLYIEKSNYAKNQIFKARLVFKGYKYKSMGYIPCVQYNPHTFIVCVFLSYFVYGYITKASFFSLFMYILLYQMVELNV